MPEKFPEPQEDPKQPDEVEPDTQSHIEAEASAESLFHEASEISAETSVVPELDRLGTNEFVAERSGRLRNTWQKAKGFLGKVGHKVGDKFAIEYSGYRFSPAENMRARVGNFRWMWRAIKNQSPDADGKNAVLNDPLQNPGIEKVVAKRREESVRRARSSEENFEDRSHLDTLKIAAYELATMPVIRMGGMMALHGAARATEKITGSKKAGKVKDRLNYRLELHEQGLHNPTLRKLDGVKWRDVKPGKVEAAPIIDPKKDDLSGMKDSTIVRTYRKAGNPFAEDQTPQLVTTTVGQLRSPVDGYLNYQVAEKPRAKIQAAAEARASGEKSGKTTTQKTEKIGRNPFADDEPATREPFTGTRGNPFAN